MWVRRGLRGSEYSAWALSPAPHHTEVSMGAGAGVRQEEGRGSRFWSGPGLQKHRHSPWGGGGGACRQRRWASRVPAPLLPAVSSRSCRHHAQAPGG